MLSWSVMQGEYGRADRDMVPGHFGDTDHYSKSGRGAYRAKRPFLKGSRTDGVLNKLNLALIRKETIGVIFGPL